MNRLLPYLLLLFTISFINGCAKSEPPQTEIVGQVIDSVTLQPIEDAYVIATYDLRHVPYDYACAKALGTYTDKTGNYRFPFEKSDRYPRGYPHEIFAVKKGFYFSAFAKDRSVDADKTAWVRDRRTRVYLAKRDYSDIQQGYNTYHANCAQARNRQDAAASIDFLKFELDELRTLRANSDVIASRIRQIREMQRLPEVGGVYPEVRIESVSAPDENSLAPDLLPPVRCANKGGQSVACPR